MELSRHITEVWDHPSIQREPEAFLDALCARLGQYPEPSHVFPLDEPSLVALARARTRLPAGTSLAVPDTDTVLTCLDKERCLGAAEAAGLAVPAWEIVRDHHELVAATADLAAGVIVKPLWPHSRLPGDRKAIVCREAGDLGRALSTWPAGQERLLVQRLLRGPRHNLYFAARDGTLLDVVEVLCTRTNRCDGTGLAVAGRTRPVSTGPREQLVALVTHLRYTGVGFAQFVVEPGADGGFIELNPRISGSYLIADQAGLDMANIAVDLAAGRPVESPPAPTRRAGHTWAWTFGDITGLRDAVENRQLSRVDAAVELSRIVRVGLRADVHLTWSWRDPLPTIATWWRYLMRPGLRRASSRLRRLRTARRHHTARIERTTDDCSTERDHGRSPSARHRAP